MFTAYRSRIITNNEDIMCSKDDFVNLDELDLDTLFVE